MNEPQTSPKKLKRADRVRWRLLSEDERECLINISLMRDQSISTVLRILLSRFRGNVDAYADAVHANRKTPRASTRGLRTSDDLRALLGVKP
jgi:hypothetical protein